MVASTKDIHSVAVVGAGVAGSALACLLQQRGYQCTLFASDPPSDLLVGESLIPAVIPMLRRLGIEERVAAISSLKRGVAFRNQQGDRIDFVFQASGSRCPDYAYNIPRPEFDRLVRQRAAELGAKIILKRARVEAVADSTTRSIRLTDESLSDAGLSQYSQPDLLIDATGRTRLFSRVLGIGSSRGPRSDVAYFAHFNNCDHDAAVSGQVLLTLLENGWSWQIPLQGRVSIGVVLDSLAARKYGDTPQARLESVVRNNPVLREATREAFQCAPVQAYANYQLISDRAHGPGWVALGDAFGFVDPMLSPGVFMALESANLLDRHVFSGHQLVFDKACRAYYHDICAWHRAWAELIEYFYDGSIMSLGQLRAGMQERSGDNNRLLKYVDRFVSHVIAARVSGAKTRSHLYQKMLQLLCQLMLIDKKAVMSQAIRSG